MKCCNLLSAVPLSLPPVCVLLHFPEGPLKSPENGVWTCFYLLRAVHDHSKVSQMQKPVSPTPHQLIIKKRKTKQSLRTFLKKYILKNLDVKREMIERTTAKRHSQSPPPSLQSQGRACELHHLRTSLVSHRGRRGAPGAWWASELLSPPRSPCLPAWGQPAQRSPVRSESPAGTPDPGIDNLEEKWMG